MAHKRPRTVVHTKSKFVTEYHPVQSAHGVEIAGLRRSVEEAFEYSVPVQYDLVLRYLKKFHPGAARFLHEYWPTTHSDGWGWQLQVDGNFLILRSYGMLPVFREYKSEFRLSFKTRSDKRLTLGIIAGVLNQYYETVRMKRK